MEIVLKSTTFSTYLFLVVSMIAATALHPVAAAASAIDKNVDDEMHGTSQPATASKSPRSNPRGQLHHTPRPLPKGAIVNDWPSFLGPFLNATTNETKILKRFPMGGPTLLWEVETGTGYSAPAVVGDRVILHHRLANEEIVECLERETGRLFWTYSYPCHYGDRFQFSNGPRSSPVVSGNLVFTHGVEGKLHCFDLLTGNVIWARDTSSEFRVPKNFFGVGSTPLIHGDLLIVHVGAEGGPCVVAMHKKTGKTAWKAGDQWEASYASPIPARIHGEDRILVFAGGDSDPPVGGLLSIAPKSGNIETRFPFRSKKYESVNAANPLVIDNRIFLTSSYNTGGVMLEIKSDGGHEIVWKSDALRAHFATPIHVDGYIYGFDGMSKHGTSLVCVDAGTGRQVWQEFPEWKETVTREGKKSEQASGPYRGSLIRIDGRFLLLGEEGHLAWVDLTPSGYRELDRVRLFHSSETWTAPVISHGLLFICQNHPDKLTGTPSRLLCYDLRGSD